MRYAFAANLATLGIITLPLQTGSSLSFDGNGIWIGDLSMLSMTSGELKINQGKLLLAYWDKKGVMIGNQRDFSVVYCCEQSTK